MGLAMVSSGAMPSLFKSLISKIFICLFVLGAGFGKGLQLCADSGDPHSYADPEAVKIHSFHLKLQVSFREKILRGTVTHIIESRRSNYLKLDTNKLKIHSVKLRLSDGSWQNAHWVLGASDETLGAPLIITLPTGSIGAVEIAYETLPGAPALDWIEENQTASGKDPFLYALSSSHNARSWIPLQDLPAARYKFTAEVRVPPNLMAVMSAGNNPHQKAFDGVYRFAMHESIPPYLLGLAVGDLKWQAVGPRSGFFVEEPFLKTAAEKLKTLEQSIDLLESWIGPMPFSRHDVLMMPRTFPIGGMEVPYLNLVNQGILGNNLRGISVVWHELVHSWIGNAVTCKTLDHYWLNEGLVVYYERRLAEFFLGKTHNLLDLSGSYQRLKKEMREMIKSGKPAETALVRFLDNRHPSDKLSSVPYDKGFLFFYNLEALVGRDRLDQFVQKYVEHYKFRSLDSEEFLEFLKSYLPRDDNEWDKMRARLWIYDVGFLPGIKTPRSKVLENVQLAAKKFQNGAGLTERYVQKWSYLQWDVFLSSLEGQTISQGLYENLRRLVNPSDSKLPVGLLFRWFKFSIEQGYIENLKTPLQVFLTTRPVVSYYVQGLAKALMESESGKTLAKELFPQVWDQLHHLSRVRCSKILADLNLKLTGH